MNTQDLFHTRNSMKNAVGVVSEPKLPLEYSKLGGVKLHVSEDLERTQAEISSRLADFYWNQRFLTGMEFQPFLLRARKASYGVGSDFKNFCKIDGKILITGAAGERALNKWYFSQVALGREPADVNSELATLGFDASEASAEPERYLIEVKNYFNFFHFITENLGDAFIADRHSSCKEIILVANSRDPKPFVHAWLELLRKGLHSEIKVDYGKQEYKDIGIVASTRSLAYFDDERACDLVNRASPAGWKFTQPFTSRLSRRILSLSSVQKGQALLREAAISTSRKICKHISFGNLIYVARKQGSARERLMKGEGDLQSALIEIGFSIVFFEDLRPDEQVLVCCQADIIVMQHGAGLANMMFVRPDCHIIEIGTLQTLRERWADFVQLANVSQCVYHHIVAPMAEISDGEAPRYSDVGLLPPSLRIQEIDLIVELVCSLITSEKTTGDLENFNDHFSYFHKQKAAWNMKRLLKFNENLQHTTHHYHMNHFKLAKSIGDLDACAVSLEKAWEFKKTPRIAQKLIAATRQTRNPEKLNFLEDEIKRLFPRKSEQILQK